MTTQLALDLPLDLLTPDLDDADLSIQEAFQRFHGNNPWVLESLEVLTRDYLARGHTQVGIGMLFEVLRWQYDRATTGDDFRLNNNYRSRYVRLLIARHPEWSDVFETRGLRSA